MPRPDLALIAERLAEADLLDVLLADPVTWPVEAMIGEPDATMAYLGRIQDGARIILQACRWPEPPAFWAISVDEQKTPINQDWSPRPRDRIEANRAGAAEQHLYNGKPALIPSPRWLTLDVMRAVADLRSAIEAGSPMEIIHPVYRLGWSVSQLFVLFNYGGLLDEIVRVVDGGMRGARAPKEIEMQDKITVMGRELFEQGHSASNCARLIRTKLQRDEPADTKIPGVRRIREIIDQRKGSWRKAGKPPTT
jgi:hypothetical protein